MLLLTLSACSTKTVIKTEYRIIPKEFLQCDNQELFLPSDESYEDAELGDFKLLSVEIGQELKLLEIDYLGCVNNASNARAYQDRMINE